MCAHKAHGRQSAKAAIKHAGREITPRNAGKEKPQKADTTAGSLMHSRRAAAPPCTPARRAKQSKQRQQRPRTQAHGGQTGAKVLTTAAGGKARRPGTKMQNAGPSAAKRTHGRQGCSREHTPGHPGAKAAATAAGRARTASPPYGAARRTQKNPSEQAKFAFALLPARRGHVNRGRQKIASLFLAGTVFLAAHCAQCRAQRRTKGGAAPFDPLQAF